MIIFLNQYFLKLRIRQVNVNNYSLSGKDIKYECEPDLDEIPTSSITCNLACHACYESENIIVHVIF